MAGGKLGFWSSTTNAILAFLLCVLVIIMAAQLVYSSIYGKPSIPAEEVAENTAPVGRIYQRPE